MKQIPGHSHYFATAEGKIISTRRYPRGKVLDGYVNEDGYLTVTVTADDGVKRKTLVHRLIASAFLGSCPDGEHLVRHLDGDKSNNYSVNLAWGTELSNFHDAVGHGTRKLSPSGNGRVLGQATVLQVLRCIEAGLTGVEVSRATGVSKAQVSRIKNGRRWRHLTAA
jgi:hypothetical protein